MNFTENRAMRIQALEETRSRPVKEVALEYDIPRTTLNRWKLRGLPENGPGRPRVLSTHDEEALHEWVTNQGNVGDCPSREEVKEQARRIHSTSLGQELSVSCFSSSRWFLRLLRDNPEIGRRRPEQLEEDRQEGANPVRLRDAMQEWKLLLELAQPPPEHTWNADETMLIVQFRKKKAVITNKSRRHAYTVGDDKQVVTTMLACGAADGFLMPPTFIFARKTLPREYEFPEGVTIRNTPSGWISGDLFAEWFEQFHAVAVSRKVDPDKPIVLIVDGHSSHVTEEMKSAARARGVLVWVLPSHTSHLTQPLDNGFFKAFKESIREWADSKRRDPRVRLTRYDLPRAYHYFRRDFDRFQCIADGFRVTGLMPFDEEKLLKNAVEPMTFPWAIDILDKNGDLAQLLKDLKEDGGVRTRAMTDEALLAKKDEQINTLVESLTNLLKIAAPSAPKRKRTRTMQNLRDDLWGLLQRPKQVDGSVQTDQESPPTAEEAIPPEISAKDHFQALMENAEFRNMMTYLFTLVPPEVNL
eukprot:Rmarinus@m.8802